MSIQFRNRLPGSAGLLLLTLVAVARLEAQSGRPTKDPSPRSYLGFDKNIYPGEASFDSLRTTFSFTGYWLNTPPGAKSPSSSSTWLGKRASLRGKGFGFLVLFNGKSYAQLKASGDSGRAGKSDGELAAQVARREGFPPRTILFLDQEEGGRLLPEQRTYMHAWVDAVSRSGYRAGVYCSGIASHEAGGADVVTAEDIRENAGSRDITYFIANDQCPPSPGCVRPRKLPAPSASGVAFAAVWQFAQSPRRKQFTKSCAGSYATDGNCYAPGKILVDLDIATSPDPSNGR